MREYQGEPEIRKWLESAGFGIYANHADSSNECGWYACRRSRRVARRCELNNDKQGMQIVVRPYSRLINGQQWRSVEIELCGEYSGIWWKMLAYSISPDDLPEKLGDLERGLIAAWNALEAAGT